MAQPTSNPKIEELRFRIKSDPKSRLFYPLAEELRKITRFDEAEQVLRGGLQHHPTYLSAWVSLGRVLRDQQKNDGAIDSLKRALQLDPGNVVVARLLADAYLAIGDKVEAIKKYKLVQALMPGDQDLEGVIQRLDSEINPEQAAAPESALPVEGEEPPAPPPEAARSPLPAAFEFAAPTAPATPARVEMPRSAAVDSPEIDTRIESPFARQEGPFEEVEEQAPQQSEVVAEPGGSGTPFADRAAPMDQTSPHGRPRDPDATLPTLERPFDASVFAGDQSRVMDEAARSMAEEKRVEHETGDDEPMAAAHAESPFEEPSGYTSAALTVEKPSGIHIESAPRAADLATPWGEREPEVASPVWSDDAASSSGGAAAQPAWSKADAASDVFAPAESPPAGSPADDLTNTLTMAELYIGQGLVDEARQIYDNILSRDPDNLGVRARRDALDARPPSAAHPDAVQAKVTKLEGWLSKMGKKEGGRV